MTDPTDRIARAICREKCAFMGEPPCFDKSIFGEEPWPNPYCDEPGCHALAAAVVAEIGKDTGGQAVTPTEHLARVILAELQRQDDGVWIDPRLTDDGVLMSNADAPSLGYVFLDGGFDLLVLAEAVLRGLWQPIKTAPRDGIAGVIVYDPDDGVTVAQLEIGATVPFWSNGTILAPTHWMPIPPEPEAKP